MFLLDFTPVSVISHGYNLTANTSLLIFLLILLQSAFCVTRQPPG